MSAVSTFHVPRGCPAPPTRTAGIAGLEAPLPDLSPENLREIAAAARAASARLRAQRQAADVLPSLAAAAAACARWARSDTRLHAALATLTRLSLPMLEHGLPLLFAPFTVEALRELLEADLGSPDALDGPHRVARGRILVRGPAPAVHFAAGNVPGLGISPLLLTLLVKGAAIVKPSMREPLLTAHYAQTLASLDPDLADCCAVVPWDGEREDLNRAACDLAEVVTITGSDEAVRAVQAASRGRVLAFGPRTSLAVVGSDAGLGEAAQAVAVDIALYDQRGCLSPRAVYVEGPPERAHDFAAALARALEETAATLPPGQLSLEESAAVRRFRDEAEWEGLGGAGRGLWFASSLGAGSVVWEPALRYAATPDHRCVRVHTVGALADLEALLPTALDQVEAVGAEGRRTREAIAALAAALRVSRVCPLGRMQEPPLGWPQGGRPRLGDLLHWTVLEEADRE